MFNKGDWVVVLGCTIKENGNKSDISFKICKVLEVGLDDLLVDPGDRWGNRPFFIPQTTCYKLPVQVMDPMKKITKPDPGDLVLYFYQDYSKKETFAVHLLEIKYVPGISPTGLILSGGEQKEVPYEHIMLLEKIEQP